MIRLLAVGLVIALAAGCATKVFENDPWAGDNVGGDAADIARAKAQVVQDEIDLLEKQREGLVKRQADLLKDAENYRDSAARAWTAPRLGDSERAAYARQYSTLAEERTKQADRCAQLIATYDGRITILKSKRRDLLNQADRFEAMRAAPSR